MKLLALFSATMLTMALAADECAPITWKRALVAPGAVNCRHSVRTPSNVDAHTCEAIAKNWDMSVKDLYRLNADLGDNCDAIQAKQEVCVRGFIEPLRAWDGLCGPQHKNATCIGTDKQCCSSKTWTCGNSEEDCAADTCYEGDCN